MRVLVTGASGQVGQALQAIKPSDVDGVFTARADLDIANETSVLEYVANVKPDVIVNAAAYTAVDKAETNEPDARSVNSLAPRYLAQAALRAGRTRMIQISTDFVFDGQKSSPYRPDDSIAPLSVYGRSKADGEAAVLHSLGDGGTVVRTSWIYAAAGHNFVRTMLRLFNERGVVSVVTDQIGTPTSASSLAQVIWRFAKRPELSGIFHWTDAGVASWYDFAVAIAEEGAAAGLIHREVTIKPIPSKDYPTPARRPAYSVLDKESTLSSLGVSALHWRAELRAVLREVASA